MTSTGYTRQSSASIITGNTIQASDFNNEYNAIQTAFDAIVGHTHNGSTGQGGPVIAQGLSGATAGGTANALTATITGFSLATGDLINIFAIATPTGPATLAINGGSAIPIYKLTPSGIVANSAGDWVAGLPMTMVYNGSVWINLTVLYNGSYTSLTTNYSLLSTDQFKLFVNTTPINVTLSASSGFSSYFYADINANGGNITLIPNGTDTIQGANANFVIYQGTSARLYTNSAGAWFINGTAAGLLPATNGGTGSKFFTVGGLTAARTLTFPDASDTVVTLSASQTLTNKTLTSPSITGATLTSSTVSGLTVTSTTGTLTISSGKTFTASNTLTLSGTDGSSVAFGTGGTVLYTNVTSLSSLTSASSLATVGTITSGIWQGTAIGSTYGGTGVNNGANTITLGGNVNTAGAFTTLGANSLTLTTTGTTSVTLPTSGTLVNSAVTTLSSLTTVGTIGTGVWQGTAVGATYGGTGINSSASTGIPQVSSGTWSVSTTLPSGLTLASNTIATTQSAGDNSTKIATTAYVATAVGSNTVHTVTKQIFTSSGTYTPTIGMLYCWVRAVGAGGGGSGAASGAANGGAAGGYAEATLTAAQIGASKAVTIGAKGTGGASAAGTAGTGTSLGTLVVVGGGAGGNGTGTSAAGGTATTGDTLVVGQPGGIRPSTGIGGQGGSGPFGSGTYGVSDSTSGTGKGSGGAGCTSNNGGDGTDGYMVIFEYCT